MSEIGDAAASYARDYGIAVFPLWPRSKKPKVENGLNAATTDIETIKMAWEYEPGMNVGGAMGQASGGVCCIDLDVDASKGLDGREVLLDWEAEHGKLPDTATAVTGRGGLHLFYRFDHPVKNSANEEIGVDIRGDGGFAMLAPSVHPNGRTVEWEEPLEDAPIADADELVEEFVRFARPAGHSDDGGMSKKVDFSRTVKEGGRNQALYSSLCSLQSGSVDDGTIAAFARYYNDNMLVPPLPEDEVRRTLHSALSHPKGNPEMDERRSSEAYADDLPMPEPLKVEDPPELSPELIHGVLRRGHKLAVTGPSKAGKTFLLIQLAEAVATGSNWLGMPCEKGRVLYCNFEVDPASFVHRCLAVAERRGVDLAEIGRNIDVWNLRGHSRALKDMVGRMVGVISKADYALVVVDPIYKLMSGSENDADVVAEFCAGLDRLANEGCSIAYVHHHSKGFQAGKSAMDRASGSGVFARDADAMLDMIELAVPDELRLHADANARAWRITSTLREFPDVDDVDVWFSFPVHVQDATGELAECEPLSPLMSAGEGRKKQAENKTARNVRELEDFLDGWFGHHTEPCPRKRLEEAFGVSAKTINRRVELSDKYRRSESKNTPAAVVKVDC